MKKILFVSIILGLALSACLPIGTEPAVPGAVTLSQKDLEGTAAVLARQTLDSLPTPTVAPSNTPVIKTATVSETAIQTVESGTVTETATPPTALITEQTPTGYTPAATTTLPAASQASTTATLVLGVFFTETMTLHPRFYGTLPPNLPSGSVKLVNKAKAEVYVSLQCTTPEGYVTIVEYPVPKSVSAKVPSGDCVYVVWAGGKKMSGSFHLGIKDGITLTIYKDRIGIK